MGDSRLVHGLLEACRKAVAEDWKQPGSTVPSLRMQLYAQDVYCATITGDCEKASEGLQRLAAATNFDNP
jgi:hypothetical protein